ncbi:thioredoxin-like 3-1, chloroplastic isoform X2 [Magnolia sinica]|uniref:thioredoxin-like 3-1, chloroplastic isoform X2 n=1 Tax=Magnolia sinica TaxID=86752 RepID=UPI002657FB4A|nr:thioredoxin-like 3-1, chloroplastic isoform X2 [Magnolia sinica]
MAVSAANSHLLYREFHNRDQPQPFNSLCNSISVYGASGISSSLGSDSRKSERRVPRRPRRSEPLKAGAFWQGVSRPTSIELEAITSVEQFDQILSTAKEISQPIIIDWIKFYFVDVNNVPQALVKRGNISKMPTIQLWKDGEMIEEVIGGHKAWLVIDEVKEMIQKHI